MIDVEAGEASWGCVHGVGSDATGQCVHGAKFRDNYCGGCNHVCCSEVACPDDVKLCWDGSHVSRDPANNCEFLPCPGCPKDLKLCDSGVALVRDPELQCEFPPCPGFYMTCDNYDDKCPASLPPVQCAFQSPCSTLACPPGHVCRENNCGECNALCCPECASDTLTCLGGSTLVRDPANNCEFPACPPANCPKDIYVCQDGSPVARDPALACDFPPCPMHCGNWQEPCDGNDVECLVSPCIANPCGLASSATTTPVAAATVCAAARVPTIDVSGRNSDRSLSRP